MKKILIIDDSRFTRLNLSKVLEQNNYEVIEAENGITGFEAIRKHNPACIISDLLMPEMDGYELLDNLIKDNIRIPVIVITADIQKTTKKRVLDAGAVAVINKPPDYPKLLGLIESLTANEGTAK